MPHQRILAPVLYAVPIRRRLEIDQGRTHSTPLHFTPEHSPLFHKRRIMRFYIIVRNIPSVGLNAKSFQLLLATPSTLSANIHDAH